MKSKKVHDSLTAVAANKPSGYGWISDSTNQAKILHTVWFIGP